MVLPNATAGALREIDHSSLPGRLAVEGTGCEGAKFHSPSTLLLNKVDLPDGRTVALCGTCRDNLAVLALLLAHYGQDLPWPVRREFGNVLRALLIPKDTDG
jgi:hypothetical protein